MIGAITYCKNHEILFNLILSYLNKNGHFIFTQRIDLWKKFNFDKLISDFDDSFILIYKSRPLDYLPKNKDFLKKIKIRIVLLKRTK